MYTNYFIISLYYNLPTTFAHCRSLFLNFETGAAAAVPLKPKPVVFDIGGRRFRVDVLTRVANALVVAVTGTGSSGAGRLPYTRRELLIRIAMRMWSPYAEAILQEVSVDY